MIGTTELLRLAFGASQNRSRMMAADVEKSAQAAVGTAHNEITLTRDLTGYILAGLGDLRGPPRHLPGAAKYGILFRLVNSWIGVPGGRQRRSARQRKLWVVAVNNFFERGGHDRFSLATLCFRCSALLNSWQTIG